MTATKFINLTDLRAAMFAKLKESLLGPEDARRLRMTPMMPADVLKLSLPVQRAGFQIPYFNLEGKPTKFFRFRYLDYGNSNNGFGRLVESQIKPLRYAQPSNTVNEVYLPPFIDWQEYAITHSQPIILTEGELKAACATKSGWPTIGLGGVWCFKSAKSHLPVLPILRDQFNWKDRIVFICYDSDAKTNPSVISAENALARELLLLGAFPYICRLPQLEEGRKTGLDDYIAARGADAFKIEVLDKATEWRAAQELFALNEEVVYVEDPGLILRLRNLQKMTARAFCDHAYSTRVYCEQQVGEKGTKLVEKSAPKEWLKWPPRATVERITYLPGQVRIVDGELNLWRGWGVEAQKGDVKPWKELLDFLFNGNATHRHWFEQWLAYPLQYPGTKLYQSAVMWGQQQGTGKSLLGYTMFKIYGANAGEIGDKDLYNSFNEWAENKQFVMGDEIAGGERKRDVADRMKSMVTQRQLRVNAKYVPSYTVPDCINYYFTSNHSDAFFMDDQDRRFFVNEVKGAALPNEFYKGYAAWLAADGASYLFDHLLRFNLEGYDPAAPAPVTYAKKEMIDSGRSDLGSWVAALRDTPDQVLKMGEHVLPYTMMTASELHSLYDPTQNKRVTVNGVARELKRAGFRQVWEGPIRTSQGLNKLWAVRNQETLLAIRRPVELTKLYETERANGARRSKF